MIESAKLYETVYHLSHTIGTRMAGTEKEKEAADYMLEEFRRFVPRCFEETFPVLSQKAKVDLCQVLYGGRWHSFPATLYNGAPTTGGELLTLRVTSEAEEKRSMFAKEKLCTRVNISSRRFLAKPVAASEQVRAAMPPQKREATAISTRFAPSSVTSDRSSPALIMLTMSAV